MPPTARLAIGALALLATASCDATAESGDAPAIVANAAASAERTRAAGPADSPPPEASTGEAERALFFGDLHVHSGWSFDAYVAGVTAPPEDAYRYARGEAIDHVSGESIELAGPPLDFMALTDHAEYLGVVQAAAETGHVLRRQPLVRSWLSQDQARRRAAWKRIRGTFDTREGLPALTQDAVLAPAWQRVVELANARYVPGAFTTFVAYEYTSNPDGQNLHRNVLFRGADAPVRPFSAMDDGDPEALWRWMDAERDAGRDALAIPHNANGSNGLMFAETRLGGAPIDAAWAALRARNEPAAEIFQIKGQSETHPALSPDDPWADFEIVDRRTLRAELPSQPPGSYVRDALLRGLRLVRDLGENPFALGLVGSTDGHNAASPFEERNYTGKIGRTDGTPDKRLRRVRPPGRGAEPIASLTARWSAAGLAGVWAEANTREAIFDAIRRRETFATSGPRIRVQVDASWASPKETNETGEASEAQSAQAAGVPMGGALGPAPSADAIPHLAITAQRDPLDGPLERVQVVKGWLDAAGLHERIYDVACARDAWLDPGTHRCLERRRAPSHGGETGAEDATRPLVSPEPDPATCAVAEDAGAAELVARWRDPDFVPGTRVFYSVRVLQVPTCRWTTWEALRVGRAPLPDLPRTIQERAVASPVWVAPDGGR